MTGKIKAITNAKLVLERGILWDGVLVMEDGLISAFGDAAEVKIPDGAEIIDAGGKYVGPGFVDIHVHAGGGHRFDTEPEKAYVSCLAHGETTILPTLYYDLSKEGMLEAIGRIRALRDTSPDGAAIGGIYMEGPYMNPIYGACPEKNKWKGDIVPENYKDVVDAGGELVKVWATAPERPGLESFLRYAREVNPGVVFSVGHSEANPAQIRALRKYGIRLQTHCMDATGRVSKWRGTRGCGPDEYDLTDPEMYAELICDSHGIHVNPDLLALVLAVKGEDRVILITDCFASNEESPADLRHIKDLVFDANHDLNGSKLTMNVACRNIMGHTNCGIAGAFKLGALNPARLLGMDGEIGSICVGKRANLVAVDDMFHVERVFLDGREIPAARDE